MAMNEQELRLLLDLDSIPERDDHFTLGVNREINRRNLMLRIRISVEYMLLIAFLVAVFLLAQAFVLILQSIGGVSFSVDGNYLLLAITFCFVIVLQLCRWRQLE